MKYGTIWKNTLREIRQSFGRFIAILAIVALGVGLFSGLKVTRAAMSDAVQSYLEAMNFYDYRLVCTYGFEQEDVEFLKAEADAEAVEGALSFDALYRNEAGEEGAVRIYSLTEHVNGVLVLEGRMPQQPDECVVDSHLFGSDSIGEKLILSENNKEETLEHFAEREYTIVGRIQSSLYIQFERGNTSLGTGKIAGFVYLRREGFDEDYYTELYVKFRENMPLYSDAYKDFLQEKDVIWEDLAERAAERRFGRLKDDAEAEYADALEEFETEKADAEKELADAKQELDDGAAELADAEKELADAEKELEDGKKELADAKQTLEEKAQELSDGEQKLADARAEWHSQSDRVKSARSELAASEKKFKKQKALLTAEEEKITKGEKLLQDSLKANGLADIEAARKGLEQAKKQLEMLQMMVSGGDAGGSGGSEADMAAAQIAQQIAALQETIEGLTELTDSYDELTKGKAAIAGARRQLEAGKKQLKEVRVTLDNADAELGKAWTEISEAEQEISDGRSALEDARKEVADGEAKLADARKKLADGEQELADAKEKYADGLKEYEEGLEEYETKIADAEQELADARKEIDSMEEPNTYVLGRDTNVGYVCFESDSGIVDGIANVFPVFFFLVAALVCVTTMNRMVEEQRTQIGVLKALGYGEAVIMMKYIFYSGSAAIVGCIAGFFGGTYIFPKVIWTAYGIMYTVGGIGYVFDWKLAVISLIVSLLCSVGTTWLSCRMELAEMAAQLMRPKAPKAGKRVLLERLTFIWKHLSFLRKVSVRNIFRYKKRLFMMVLGISGCTALLVTGFGINDSIAEVANQQFQEIQIYDVSVTLTEEPDEETEEELAAAMRQGEEDCLVSAQIRLAERSMDIVTEERRKSTYVIVFEDGADVSPFLDLHSLKDEGIAYPGPGEAVLSHKIAGELGLGIGDTLVLEDDDLHRIKVTVSGICENFIYNYVYLSDSTYTEYMGEKAEYKSVYLNAADGADVHLLSAALMGVDGVANVTVNSDMLVRFNQMMSSLNLIVVVVIICAAMLAFIVLYNLTNINITERVREIATIKVLGFYKKETSAYVFRENTVLTLFGAIPGLLLGKWLHSFVMSQIKVDMVAFDVRVLPQSYLYSLLFTFLFAWCVNRMMSRKLEKISMTESLKSVD